MTSSRGSFDGLPEVLREIAEAAGLDAAMKLANDYGGLQMKIPRRVGPRHWLVECVGRKAADAICERYRVNDADGRPIALTVYIPLAGRGHISTGLRGLTRDLEQGLKPREAARRNGFTERTAYEVQRRLRSPGSREQHDLFAD